ncbi:ubiquitin-related modifier 1 [Gilbertella persicaria]|uniref:ubiquitin-related modifier 1 n=1 Tax=Gilbertella persicaria TaxID=101096 RepID=UPI00221EA677|nr:ubiquitin-related modifier 1 [Gilbertella persicaria]KAI8098414.1 ubiquitin-related modifier 1 [Gilbertella persicaria]
MSELTIHVEFSGGMELLFQNVSKHTIKFPATNNKTGKPSNLQNLIFHIRDTMMTEKQDLFVEKDTVRPGILVLINNTDWELCDELEYELEDKDEIVFISTLHGG